MATRATQKEYSGQPGSQNDPKMEPKMEPKGTRTKKIKLSHRLRVNPPDALPGDTKMDFVYAPFQSR